MAGDAGETGGARRRCGDFGKPTLALDVPESPPCPSVPQDRRAILVLSATNSGLSGSIRDRSRRNLGPGWQSRLITKGAKVRGGAALFSNVGQERTEARGEGTEARLSLPPSISCGRGLGGSSDRVLDADEAWEVQVIEY